MRIVRMVFIVLLGALIVLPLIEMAFPLPAITALDEKRLLAPAPDFAGTLLHGDGRLAAQINRWFDDRIGFRPWLIRLSHQIEYSIFNYSDKVYVGSDGWLYRRNLVDLDVKNERGDGPLLARLQHSFNGVADYLAARGVRLIIVSNPVKQTIYPQHLPTEAPHLPAITLFDKFRGFLKNNPKWTYVDGGDVLAHCPTTKLFYKLDQHITMPAAFCMAVVVANAIAARDGRPLPFWQPKFKFHDMESSVGGLVNFLSVFSRFHETYPIASNIYSVDQAPPDGEFNLDRAHFYDHYADYDASKKFEWVYKSNADVADKKLPPLLWFGNSFTDLYFQAGFQFQFAEAYRIRSTNATLTTALNLMPPSAKYFMFQFLEPYVSLYADVRLPGE